MGLRCLNLPALTESNQGLVGEAASTLVKHHAVTKAKLLTGDFAWAQKQGVLGFCLMQVIKRYHASTD